ncbi:hypothetical protein JYT35_00170 [Acidimicrobium ferrooxidans]|uniref:Uncharacterized protein n=1 Tax=Acidimicrobium ferrooxidans TaxID=53635 RepID=A0ABS3APW5_9ACTN|nr:hypothetical protein [Acidimicrobium ferrooxidans]
MILYQILDFHGTSLDSSTVAKQDLDRVGMRIRYGSDLKWFAEEGICRDTLVEVITVGVA